MQSQYGDKGGDLIGFVLIRVALGLEREIYEKLSQLSEISEVYPLFGKYDIIAKIEASDHKKLAEIVINKIRSIEGVLDTETLAGARL
jgi:DNA-binding Lrp family transcriptional regulator